MTSGDLWFTINTWTDCLTVMLHGTIRNDVILRNTASDSSPVVSLEKGETREGWWEGGKGKGETTGRSWVEKLTKKVKVTPTDEKKNTSSRPIGHNKYNYGEKNHKNDLAQLFDSSHNFSTQDLPVVSPFPFPPSHHPSRFSPFSRETTGDESDSIAMLEQCYNHLN